MHPHAGNTRPQLPGAVRRGWPLLLGLAAAGCSTVPEVLVARPWSRVLAAEAAIPVRSRIQVTATGATQPLVGDEGLLQSQLAAQAAELLARRGFVVSDDRPEFVVALHYRTERQFQSVSRLVTFGGGSMPVYRFHYDSWALGVMAAAAVSAAAAPPATVSTARNEDFFRHVLALEILDLSGKSVWKGETVWDQRDLDIRDGLDFVLQSILSHLPKDEAALPAVPAVDPDKVDAYVTIEMGWREDLAETSRRYTCPALPFHIDFAPYLTHIIGRAVRDWEALPAFVDLMRTAEFALPRGGDYDEPLHPKLWSRVRLGGTYRLGPDQRQVHVLIDLTGEKQGYRVDSCRLVDGKEFARFQADLAKWRRALESFYDVYRK
ncbi:MAG: hypothetical protein JNK49_10435 [Planctomycetes bacterium]|nr:hypothetical protein [Planctomycetota bacterium]